MARRMFDKQCVICGAAFTTKYKETATCSKPCKHAKVLQTGIANGTKARVFDRQCVVCGATFTPKFKSVVTCTKACADTKGIQTRIARYGRGNVMHKRCAICDALFSTTDKRKMTCSKPCTRTKTLQTCLSKYGRPTGFRTDVNHWLGRRHRVESKQKMRATHLGVKQPPEAIRKRAAAHLGKRHTPETLRKLSEVQQRRTPETKQKMSSSRMKTYGIIAGMRERFPHLMPPKLPKAWGIGSNSPAAKAKAAQELLNQRKIYQTAKELGYVKE